MAKKILVIVESPAKARTLGKILGRGCSIKASLGHVRDLPKSQLGVDTENDFSPKYVIPREKKKVVNELKRAVKAVAKVYLATDPDREGEAISWHLAVVTNLNGKSYQRVVFHELTREAVEAAFRHPRSVDMQLVNAQQARRVLDRLVGYKISPLLWKKVRRGLSAGRVQSVALKIVVDREREIEAFVPVEYWKIEAELSKDTAGATFRAVLVGLANGKKPETHSQEEAEALVRELQPASYRVIDVKTRQVTRQPAPPFITSTLQQEAWRKLRFSANYTMTIAQQLYEGLSVGDEGSMGLITYMRTDSTRIAHSAIAETRQFIKDKYGSGFLPVHARSFPTRVRGAQEAHEAIRPTRVGREPSLIKPYITAAQFRLYELIWKRMVASQMSAALFNNTTVDIEARTPVKEDSYLFRASSSANTFPGFMSVYIEGKDDQDEEKSPVIPHLEKGDRLELMGLFSKQHFTQPPPRFTEATLVKMLEQWGIGRPSTYAPILTTIQERGYVKRAGGSFHPMELGFIINDLLAKHFPGIVDIKFTAQMEGGLDGIAVENRDWVQVVRDFYQHFEENLQDAAINMEKVKLADEPAGEDCPRCGKPLLVKNGRFGKFIACSGYPACRYTKPFQIKTGVRCPQCGGELVEKVSIKRRTFYGCSRYPDCQFAINLKPLPQPCPQCGGLLTLYRQKRAKCTKCGYTSNFREQEEASITEHLANIT
jgi:DNA topoisomerase-1